MLTKKDLQDIEKVVRIAIVRAFEELIIPQFKRMHQEFKNIPLIVDRIKHENKSHPNE